jgi:flavin reductase (DIM6/NTAB) family NADH-FMN oxidoreductase RutF
MKKPLKKVFRTFGKRDLPVARVRQLLEPGPVVLVSSRHKDATNVMTMGWHTVMEFSPSLVGCMISGGNHSFELIRRSGECVLNVPTAAMAEAVVGIGNCSGGSVDKFAKFGLTAVEAEMVGAPLIAECYANIECRLHDDALVDDYNFFIFEVVKIHKAVTPKYPETLHYHGQGKFMTAGRVVDKAALFTRLKRSPNF